MSRERCGFRDSHIQHDTTPYLPLWQALVSRRLVRRQRAQSVPNWRPTYRTAAGAMTNIAGLLRWSER